MLSPRHSSNAFSEPCPASKQLNKKLTRVPFISGVRQVSTFRIFLEYPTTAMYQIGIILSDNPFAAISLDLIGTIISEAVHLYCDTALAAPRGLHTWYSMQGRACRRGCKECWSGTEFV